MVAFRSESDDRRRTPAASEGQVVSRSPRGGEGALLWPRLTVEQEFVKGGGVLSAAFRSKQREKGRGSGDLAQR
jgi:hypothetical protein